MCNPHKKSRDSFILFHRAGLGFSETHQEDWDKEEQEIDWKCCLDEMIVHPCHAIMANETYKSYFSTYF